MRESNLMRTIRLAAPTMGCKLFRNNVGALKDARGNYVQFGLCVGSSDLIGYTMRHGVAIFTAIEVKRPKEKPTKEQASYLASVQRDGGIAGVARSIDDLADILRVYDHG